jgi:VIT1/CCC1 family predicted Fe2+/Mn2+ transporter
MPESDLAELATTFAVGAVLSLLVVLPPPEALLIYTVSITSFLFLALLDTLAAGGAPIGKAALRVTFWGAQAMLLTALVGRMFGTWLSPLYLSPYHHISSILLVKRTFHG